MYVPIAIITKNKEVQARRGKEYLNFRPKGNQVKNKTKRISRENNNNKKNFQNNFQCLSKASTYFINCCTCAL